MTKLTKYGNPILRKNCIKVNEEDNVKELVDALKKELELHPTGIGIAAPQIGLSKRIFLVKGIGAIINPEIYLSGENVTMPEACLSIPNISADVERPSTVTINYFDENMIHKVEEYNGMLSRVIQHEYDHIEGVLYIDRISSLKRRMLQGKLKAISRS